MAEKVIYYPNSDKVFIKVDVDENNNIDGKINIYNKENNQEIEHKMVVKNNSVRFSEIVHNDTNIKLLGNDDKQNFIVEKGNKKIIELMGLKNSNGVLDFDGTTSSIYGNDFTLTSMLVKRDSTVRILSELKLTTRSRLEIRSNYKEVGEGNYILSASVINDVGIELLRKVYKNGGSILNPLFTVLKNSTEEEIHGVYNGSQIPSLGKIENLS